MALILMPSSYVTQRCGELLVEYESQRANLYSKYLSTCQASDKKRWAVRLGFVSASSERVADRATTLMQKDQYFLYLIRKVATISRLNWLAEKAPEIYLNADDLETLK